MRKLYLILKKYPTGDCFVPQASGMQKCASGSDFHETDFAVSAGGKRASPQNNLLLTCFRLHVYQNARILPAFRIFSVAWFVAAFR